MIRFFTILIFATCSVGTVNAQKNKPVSLANNQEKYLFNDKRLGVKAINDLLTRIEQLTRDRKSAEKERKVWQGKVHLLDSLRLTAEAKVDALEDQIEIENANRVRFEQEIQNLQSQLQIAENIYQGLEEQYNKAMTENTRIQDSLRREIRLRDRLIFKVAQEDFINGLKVVLMKDKKGKMISINPNVSSYADRDDVEAIYLYYDFTICKVLGLPQRTKLNVAIESLSYFRKFDIAGVSKGDFYHFKGYVKIKAGKEGVNLHKAGTLFIDTSIFDAEEKMETKPRTLKMTLSN